MRAQSAPWRRAVELYIASPDRKARVKEVVIEEVSHEHFVEEPSFVIDNEAAQVLMDDLWNAGLRPTEGTGSAGSLKATERHLEDMRKIAFKSLSLKS